LAQQLTRYEYCGPVNSSFTLPPETEGGETRDVLLWIGKEVELPAENEYVKSLVAQGYLKLANTPPATPSTKSTKKTPGVEG